MVKRNIVQSQHIVNVKLKCHISIEKATVTFLPPWRRDWKLGRHRKEELALETLEKVRKRVWILH